MANVSPRAGRRSEALSAKQIVDAAIDILDTDGETALTFRSLASRLATGPGALYWYVANKDELLAAAANDVVALALADIAERAEPLERLRATALAVFDAIDAHPWVGTQLSREPWQSAVLQIVEAIGGELPALDVPDHAQFDSASALVNYILGLAGQYAAAARLVPRDTDRRAFLATVAERWTQLDPAAHPFVRRLAAQLAEHDDREQFLAGIDLILLGITSAR